MSPGQQKPPKPTAIIVCVDAIPHELRALPQWVVWRFFWSEDKATWDKPPLNAHTGNLANPVNPRTWSTFEQAMTAYATGQFDGIGFVLCRENGLVGVDLDHCVSENGEGLRCEAWVEEIVQQLNTYAECSPSGTGLRLWAKGALPPAGRRKDPMEIYNSRRYLTVTGARLQGVPPTIESRQDEIDAVHARIFGPQTPSDAAPVTQDDTDTPLTDDDVIGTARCGAHGRKR
jgi:putative DNA primase/helicase